MIILIVVFASALYIGFKLGRQLPEPDPIVEIMGDGKITRATEGSAGYDVYSPEDYVVPARSKAIINTKLRMKIQPGYFGQLMCRSSLAMANMSIHLGVIDSDYTGDIKVIMCNHTDKDYQVTAGHRVAQIIFLKCDKVQVKYVDSLSTTKRGDGGFGSTGR